MQSFNTFTCLAHFLKTLLEVALHQNEGAHQEKENVAPRGLRDPVQEPTKLKCPVDSADQVGRALGTGQNEAGGSRAPGWAAGACQGEEIGALFSLDTPRTKLMAGAELCQSKLIRRPHLSILRSGKPPQLHMCRKTPGGSKREQPHAKIGAVKPPTASVLEMHLVKKVEYTCRKGS